MTQDAQSTNPKARPLSPHLQIYCPQVTSVLSILHRLTGVALSLGLLLMVIWLAALAQGQTSYDNFVVFAKAPPIQAALFGFCWAFFYHLGNGIRHLLWDVGCGFDLPAVYSSGRIVAVSSALLTFVLWLKFYGVL